MQALKQQALNTIAELPDDTDMEEIMYRLYVLENIRKGREDAEQGKTQSVDKVLSDIKTW
jgi:hypothetical protein